MSQRQLDALTQQIAALTTGLQTLLTELQATKVDDGRDALVAKIVAALEKVPDAKLSSALDYVTFLGTDVGGGEDDMDPLT